jgi:hypothetical protein
MLLAQLEGIWLNYQNFSINGLHWVTLGDRFVDPDLAQQSAESNYKKSMTINAHYRIARLFTVDAITLTYDDPDIAGAFRTN